MNRFLLGVVIGLLVLLVVAGIGTGLVYWRLAAFRTQVVHQLGQALHADVQVTTLDLDWMNGELHAAGVSLQNLRDSAPWEKASIGQAVVHFSWRDLFSPTIPLTVDVSSWSLVLRPLAAGSGTSNASEDGTGGTSASGPGKIRLDHLAAHGGEVDLQLGGDAGHLGTFQKVAFEAANNGANVWTTHLTTGAIDCGTIQAESTSVDIRSDGDQITFSNFHLKNGPGLIDGEGELSLAGDHARRATLKAVNLPVETLVATTWQAKITGLATGNLTYQGDDKGGSGRGQVALSQGRFNLLPWLGNITALVNLPNLTNTDLDVATADLEWTNGTFHFTHLDIRKNDVARIDGDVSIDPQGQVDGKLRLGLPAAVIAKWPDLQTKVFSVTVDDYSYADFHLTGTPDKLQEDLTPRVVAVGTQQGSSLLNQAAQGAVDWLKSLTK